MKDLELSRLYYDEETSNVGKLYPELIESLVGDLLKAFLPEINVLVGQLSFTMPRLPLGCISDAKGDIQKGYIEGGITFSLSCG